MQAYFHSIYFLKSEWLQILFRINIFVLLELALAISRLLARRLIRQDIEIVFESDRVAPKSGPFELFDAKRMVHPYRLPSLLNLGEDS